MAWSLERKTRTSYYVLTSTMATFKSSGKSTYASWIRNFVDGEESEGGLILEVLLSYWLSWFILPSGLEEGINSRIPVAILLAKVERLCWH